MDPYKFPTTSCIVNLQVWYLFEHDAMLYSGLFFFGGGERLYDKCSRFYTEFECKSRSIEKNDHFFCRETPQMMILICNNHSRIFHLFTVFLPWGGDHYPYPFMFCHSIPKATFHLPVVNMFRPLSPQYFSVEPRQRYSPKRKPTIYH